MWSIRILSGPQTGQIVDLKLGKNVFGRSQACDVKIQSLGISKEHCEVHVYKDKMMIVDLKSSNGTFVNGVKIQNSIIHLGDKLSLFDVIMDVIPAPDIRPKSIPVLKTPPPPPQQPMMLQVPSLQNQMTPPAFQQSGMQNVAEAYSYNAPMQFQNSSYQTMSQQAAPRRSGATARPRHRRQQSRLRLCLRKWKCTLKIRSCQRYIS